MSSIFTIRRKCKPSPSRLPKNLLNYLQTTTGSCFTKPWIYFNFCPFLSHNFCRLLSPWALLSWRTFSPSSSPSPSRCLTVSCLISVRKLGHQLHHHLRQLPRSRSNVIEIILRTFNFKSDLREVLLIYWMNKKKHT